MPANAVKFLGWLKKFEPTQNILGPVKGQSIRVAKFLLSNLCIYCGYGLVFAMAGSKFDIITRPI